MKKYLILILLLLLTCQKDEIDIVEPEVIEYEMIFEESQSSVTDGQEYSFEISLEEEHQLILSKDGNVIAKESFLPTLGINTKTIYTKSLPIELLKFELINSTGVVKTTFIQIY